MKITFPTLALALLSATNAIVITSPKMGQVVLRNESLTVEWTSVPTDATNFTIATRLEGDSSAKAVQNVQGVIQVKDKKTTLEGSSE